MHRTNLRRVNRLKLLEHQLPAFCTRSQRLQGEIRAFFLACSTANALQPFIELASSRFHVSLDLDAFSLFLWVSTASSPLWYLWFLLPSVESFSIYTGLLVHIYFLIPIFLLIDWRKGV